MIVFYSGLSNSGSLISYNKILKCFISEKDLHIFSLKCLIFSLRITYHDYFVLFYLLRLVLNWLESCVVIVHKLITAINHCF